MAKESASEEPLHLVTIEQKASVYIPPPGPFVAVRTGDWRRIYRNVERMPPQRSWLRDWFFLLLGIPIPMALAAVTIDPQSRGLPTCVTTLLWCIVAGAAVGAFLCWKFASWSKATTGEYVQDHILSEMDEIERLSRELVKPVANRSSGGASPSD